MTGRRLYITAYADGCGRIAIDRVSNGDDPRTSRLFGEDRPFAAARIDPATFQALWIGLFAESIDEPMPAIDRSATR